MTDDVKRGRSPLLVVIGGRTAKVINDLGLTGKFEVLVLDTDSRTDRNFPAMNVETVGVRIVKGEGCGGNMNLARACFRVDMDRIAPMVLGRPLVMIAASTDGATGIAGAVELSSLLARVGMASFSFLLHEDRSRTSGMDPLRIASILLDGPLRPGCVITSGTDDAGADPFGLGPVLPCLLEAGSEKSDFPAPQGAWAAFREDGGPFKVGIIKVEHGMSVPDISPPAMVSLRVPSTMTNLEVRTRLDTAFGEHEGIHLSLISSGDAADLEGAFISKSVQKPGFQEGPPIDPDLLKELLGEPDIGGIERSLKIM